MAFRTRASIDPNNHKGIIVQNSNGLGGLLVPTGRSSAGAISIDVSVVDGNGNQITSFGSVSQPATAIETNVASSASTVSLLISNPTRKQALFFNDSTQTLYLKLGTTASTSSYTVQVLAGGYYELPQPVYTGAIDGLWTSANGNARITEM